MKSKQEANTKVVFLNPKTCGIYKSGGTRYKTDPDSGLRTQEIDNELIESVDNYLKGTLSPGDACASLNVVYKNGVLVPTYYDQRYNEPFLNLIKEMGVSSITIGELNDDGIISIQGGHGSPGNDQRLGSIPYIKVSDIRALRVNVNPTNMVTESVARRFWKGENSGLQAWDLITPNRASSNIGEFAIILPGEEEIVVTKEVFILRVILSDLYDSFYLLWAFSLKAVRDQWRRIALMQTNREDCGSRYREIAIPKPPNKEWAQQVSAPFSRYFSSIANARESFISAIASDPFYYVASVKSFLSEVNTTELDLSNVLREDLEDLKHEHGL